MKVLITGAAGQLGQELQKTMPANCEVTALARHDLDISDEQAVKNCVHTLRPVVIINAAAYNAVDQAESEPDTAMAINANAVTYLADAAAHAKAHFIHVSTDYVFDGLHNLPYLTTDQPRPLSAYARSKRVGEQQALAFMPEKSLVVRTSWVFASDGKNFVKTILKLLSTRESISVIADQVGTPTWANTLAQAIWRAAELQVNGMQHWTEAGVASWYDFACAIQEEALALGLLNKAIPIRPITTPEYPLPAKRPAYSVLDKNQTWRELNMVPLHWREALRQMLRELAHA